MDPSACLYQILEVPPGATKEEIRSAYQKKAQKWHPDRHGGSEVATRNFIAIRNAFEILHDERRRAQYDADQARKESSLRTPSSVPPEPQAMAGRKGDNLRVFAQVPLQLLLEGGPLKAVGMVGSVCRRCSGWGCAFCRGSGQVLTRRYWLVHIPPAYPPNRLLRFSGAGHTGPFFTRPGDVYIHLQPQPAYGWHWNLERERLEKVVRVPSSFIRQGGRLRIRAPSGVWGHVPVPPTPASLHWVFIPGHGLQVPSGGRGMWLCVKVGLWFSWGARRVPDS